MADSRRFQWRFPISAQSTKGIAKQADKYETAVAGKDFWEEQIALGPRQDRTVTVDQVPVFSAKTREHDSHKWKGDPEYLPLYLSALHSGMRAGGLAGLRWGNIDRNGKFLKVRRSVKRGRIYSTKTGRNRRIDMADDLIEELIAYRGRRLEEALKDG